ncbi:hypothetical protein QO062_09650 [Fervidobacterium pennivorans subsp. carthaginiensis]|uniref:hypothetical protein n=1 Tax=Fervidobacterium pennivorans TaxID=93466 RepID=UPI00355BB3FD
MKKIKVLRVGGLNVGSLRFLDFLSSDSVEELTLVDYEAKSKLFQEIVEGAKFFNKEKLLDKLKIVKLPDNKTGLQRYVRGASIRIISRILLPRRVLTPFFPELEKINQIIKEKRFDVVWVGDNYFDLSNLMFYYIHRTLKKNLALPTIRSYKESKYKRNSLERYMLSNCERYIFPHQEYLKFFGTLYNIHLEGLSDFADLDWRYSELVSWVKNLQVRKLSAEDNRVHVCILTGIACSVPSGHPDAPRYFYVPLIEQLVKRGIYVHLHALRILPSPKGENVYETLSKKTAFFKIEKPLRLVAGSADYEILRRYDAGLLHMDVPNEAKKLHEFQKINVPNRLYELQMADVVPIIKKGTLPATERIITETNFGIIYENYDDLSDQLNELLKGNLPSRIQREKVKDFSDFTSVFLDAARKII